MLPDLQRSGGFIGLAGMAVTAFLYGNTVVVTAAAALDDGPVGPLLLALAMGLVWLVLLVLTGRWFTRRPVWAFWVPFVAAALWFAVVLGSGGYLTPET